MATPIYFAEVDVLIAPPMGDGLVPALARDGQLVSCWRLSHEELLEIVDKGVVWLSVSGADRTQPAVIVSGQKAAVI